MSQNYTSSLLELYKYTRLSFVNKTKRPQMSGMAENAANSLKIGHHALHCWMSDFHGQGLDSGRSESLKNYKGIIEWQ